MHTGKVEKVPDAELQALLEDRLAGITIPPKLEVAKDGNITSKTNPEYTAKVKYETDRLKEGWNALCECGWTGNNPHASEEDAQLAVVGHYEFVNLELRSQV